MFAGVLLQASIWFQEAFLLVQHRLLSIALNPPSALCIYSNRRAPYRMIYVENFIGVHQLT
jgi:hypothetical protein